MFRKSNLIVVGLLLLLIFAVAVWLVGIKIDETVNRMHRSMIKELGQYRTELIQQDFDKTGELTKQVHNFLEEKGYERQQFSDLFGILLRLDNKISRAWFRTQDDCVICTDSVCYTGVVLPDTLFHIRGSGLYYDNLWYWTICGNDAGVSYGFDISLNGLHAYFSDLTPARKNYAYILNEQGILIAHPDEKRVGTVIRDTSELGHLKQVVRKKKLLQAEGFSSFLLLPVEKLYYPVIAGSETWVVVINILQLDNEEAMAGFHRYTLFIVLITVIIFTILLIYSQYRWRKEYDLRQKAEQEAMRLNMQQLKNQLNPHFLFNALNSLSALIASDPALARKFVLGLSKVYRYVLEKRNENLAPLKEELDFTRHYYFLQKIRFGDQLNLQLDPGVEGISGKIPVMSLQLLIENAIKHNEITRQYPLNINVYAEQHILVVKNTYRPRADETEESTGVGLKSIATVYSYYVNGQHFVYEVNGNEFVVHLPILE